MENIDKSDALNKLDLDNLKKLGGKYFPKKLIEDSKEG